MPSELRDSARHVRDYLQSRGVAFEIVEFPDSTRTAREVADCVGCNVSQIATSLVFREKSDDRPVLVIASGADRVDVDKIRDATGLVLGKADGAFAKARVGFAIGGVPPAGHVGPPQSLLDSDLRRHDIIWAAGASHAVFRLRPDDLGELTGGRWLSLAAPLDS